MILAERFLKYFLECNFKTFHICDTQSQKENLHCIFCMLNPQEMTNAIFREIKIPFFCVTLSSELLNVIVYLPPLYIQEKITISFKPRGNLP